MKIEVFKSVNKEEWNGNPPQFYPIDFSGTAFLPKNDRILLEMYNAVPELSAPIDYLATIFASMEWKFVKYQTNGNEKELELPEYEVLLERPNPFQNNSDFLKTAAIQYFLQGGCYINTFKGVGISKPSYMFILPPQYVTPIFEKMQVDRVDPNADFRFNEIIGYQLKYSSTFKKNIPVSDIIYVKDSQVNFDNGEYATGSSRAYKAIMATKTIKAGYDAKYTFYKNRGALGIFVNDDPDGSLLDSNEIEEVKKNFIEKYGLSEGKSLFKFINHNVKYISVSPDFAGLRINENNEADFRAICKAIGGFPPSLISDNRVALLRDSKEADNKLYKNIIKPFAIDFYEKLSIGLGITKDNIWCVPDFSKIDAFQPDREKEESILDKRQSRLERLYALGLLKGDYILQELGLPTGGFNYKTNENGNDN